MKALTSDRICPQLHVSNVIHSTFSSVRVVFCLALAIRDNASNGPSFSELWDIRVTDMSAFQADLYSMIESSFKHGYELAVWTPYNEGVLVLTPEKIHRIKSARSLRADAAQKTAQLQLRSK